MKELLCRHNLYTLYYGMKNCIVLLNITLLDVVVQVTIRKRITLAPLLYDLQYIDNVMFVASFELSMANCYV